MKLTNKNAWHTFAGGSGAASDKYSYQAMTTIGEYNINPVSSQGNYEKHIGYSVQFANTEGKLPGGLWHNLKPTGLVDLPQAKRICQQHMEKHQGEILIPSKI